MFLYIQYKISGTISYAAPFINTFFIKTLFAFYTKYDNIFLILIKEDCIMEEKKNCENVKSVFKHGYLTREAYTEAFIKLVNTVEKSKEALCDGVLKTQDGQIED